MASVQDASSLRVTDANNGPTRVTVDAKHPLDSNNVNPYGEAPAPRQVANSQSEPSVAPTTPSGDVDLQSSLVAPVASPPPPKDMLVVR